MRFFAVLALAGAAVAQSTATSTVDLTTVIPSAAPIPSMNGTAPGASVSVITISTCVPTVSYSTVTLAPTSATTPSSAPVGTGSAPSASAPSGGAGSSGPISPSITPFTGAGAVTSGSMAFAGLAAVAALVLA
ncbi:MAG: hypothetical protein Q9227_003725 [Pyrenula ochraceoflavens]